MLNQLQRWLEYFGGAADTPPISIPPVWKSILTGVLWALFVSLIALFCGQSSKFIYIDF